MIISFFTFDYNMDAYIFSYNDQCSFYGEDINGATKWEEDACAFF